jgi:hypothetical protein
MWTAASSALAPRPAIPPDVNGVQVGEVVPLAGSLDVDQTSRAGGASRRSRQQHMGFRRLPENSGAQVQNLDHMKHSGVTQPTAVHVRLERGNLIFRDTGSFTRWR